MDGRGRLAQSLTWIARRRGKTAETAEPHARAGSLRARLKWAMRSSRLGRLAQRITSAIVRHKPPRGTGVAATVAVMLASAAYGVVQGDHVGDVVTAFKDARDGAANAFGFRIEAIALTGEKHVSREDILSVAGVTPTTSLVFLDVEAARERLKTDPWIADVKLLKLYPSELQITITEREPFALWQQQERLAVIAEDGTVLDSFANPRLIHLPLVVGMGAETRAKEFLTMLDRFPDVRAAMRAAVLIGERRWNLRLKTGLDVRLPETDPEAALDRLVKLDRDKKLLSRAIAVIDLRLADRVTVRLADAAAPPRADPSKGEKAKKKGHDT